MELTVEKLIYGGDGLARMPQAAQQGAAVTQSDQGAQRGEAAPHQQGKTVFVPFVLPGERVEATIIEAKPGFARARLDKVSQAAPDRVQPGCPYFGECGGCQYQHTGYERQVEIKREILRETLARLAKVELGDIVAHPSPPWHYRNRTRMKLRDTPFAIGYYRFRSHTLLPVRECPISSPLINQAITTMWKLGESGRVPPGVAEIEFFANAEDAVLLVELTLPHDARPDWPKLAAFAGSLRSELQAVVGVSVFRNQREGLTRREDTPQRWKEDLGTNSMNYNVGSYNFQVTAGSFFQTNRFLAATLMSLGTAGRSGRTALDLYAGTGLFTLPLSQSFRQVVAVEAAPGSFADLKKNVPHNVEAHRAATDKFLAHLPAAMKFDYVVVDPPRGGMGEKVATVLAGLAAPRITYVSCDPATLARDLRVLRAHGYEIEAAHMVDLFPQTFHIETVLHLSR